jgi:hypothetical protein
MGLFVDLIALSEARTNATLELMCKAEHGDDDAIWREHDSPYIRRLIELFTQRGLMRLESFRTELVAWLKGERHTHAGTTMPRPEGSMRLWTPEERGLVKLYLETLPPERWTLDDHMMMVDYLVQRYLPESEIRTEAEWLTTRASLMGRVQANLEKLSAEQVDQVLQALPTTVREARELKPTAKQLAAMDFARERACEAVTRLADDARHRMRYVVAQDVERRVLRVPDTSPQALEQRLFDEFSTLNRDMRRIAVTEAGNAANTGYIATLPPGRRVKRTEQYRGVCAWCARINGRIFTVVDPSKADKDGETEVWVGKDNVGRSAAPRKRVGQLLVEREPHELYWVACGTQHPHCRGTWLPVADDQPGDDPQFAAWLNQLLTKKEPA